jgi:hypothetical protein
MRLASPHTTYGTHRGAWYTFHEVRMLAVRVTEHGPRLIDSPADLAEGAILQTHEGRYLEVFFADSRGRYFCENVDAGEETAA